MSIVVSVEPRGEAELTVGTEPAGGLGVFYAAAERNDDVDSLVVRMEMTTDTSSDVRRTRYAVGPEAAGSAFREWMVEMSSDGAGEGVAGGDFEPGEHGGDEIVERRRRDP